MIAVEEIFSLFTLDTMSSNVPATTFCSGQVAFCMTATGHFSP